MQDLVKFTITDLQARVAEEFRVLWAGREYNPGPVHIELDRAAGTRNAGRLDYGSRRASADFHLLLSFPEFARTLNELEADPELARPLALVVRSEGRILADHSFLLDGRCDLAGHALLPPGETRASILPGT